jgi:hypothetical protein
MRTGYILAKSGSEYGQMARFCENGHEPSNSVKGTSGQQRSDQLLSSEYPQWR